MKSLVIFATLAAAASAFPSGIDSRIIGGENASAGSFPFAAAVTYRTADGTYFCGASLISSQFLLTAGHCVNGAVSFSIILGSGKRDGSDPTALQVSTGASHLHPDFQAYPPNNDIGLIELHLPIQFTDYIRPIELPNIALQSNAVVIAIGWGETSDSDPSFSENVQRVTVSVLPNEECKRIYGDAITDTIACIEGNNNEGTCRGDSGGPLIQYRNGRTAVIVGISSFSAQECESSNPSGFSRVFEYVDWINTIAQ